MWIQTPLNLINNSQSLHARLTDIKVEAKHCKLTIRQSLTAIKCNSVRYMSGYAVSLLSKYKNHPQLK